MKKVIIALTITVSSMLLSSCDTMCCDDGKGHCCPTGKTRTCPKSGYNAWWY
ncbi:hypothetical protein [Legionella santicrucis]|uniref:hypothetical protein n=1 Tax=Legionella santicrucis TaxID=45074 RepID=UPI0013EE8E77|nr:hypothetical protein [Legionella santicrucis]